MTEIESLRERVAKAVGPDRELEKTLWFALAPGAYDAIKDTMSFVVGEHGDRIPNYSLHDPRCRLLTSIDAALALVERKLPGSGYSIIRFDNGLGVQAEVGDGYVAEAPTAPLAVLSALLVALSQEEPGRA